MVCITHFSWADDKRKGLVIQWLEVGIVMKEDVSRKARRMANVPPIKNTIFYLEQRATL
jgi:hypothetical protein